MRIDGRRIVWKVGGMVSDTRAESPQRSQGERILLVCYHSPEDRAIGAVRVRKFADDLTSFGCEVRYLHRTGISTTFRPTGAEPPGMEIALPGRRSGAIRRVAGWLVTHAFAVPDRQLFRSLWMIRRVRQLGDWTPNVILTSGPPFSVFLTGFVLSKRWSAPWIADYRDLWTSSSYYALGACRRSVDRAIERRLLSRASLALTVSEPLATDLRPVISPNIAVIMNGFDIDEAAEFASITPDQPGLPLRLVYTGEIYEGKRDPEPLFRALSHGAFRASDVVVHFYGETVASVRAAARRHSIDSLVVTHGPVSRPEALRLQREADLLLLLLWNDPGEAGVYSTKIFEYLSARRPILMLGYSSGVAAALVRERRAGFVVNDADEIASVLRGYIQEKSRHGWVAPLPQSAAGGLSRRDQAAALLEFVRKLR